MRADRRVSLTIWLALLVLGAVVPLLLFAGTTLFQISKDSQITRDQAQADTVRALALAVDGEVHAWKAALAALAESKSAQPGRWAEFYEEARQVAAQHDGWVVLTVASGEQLLNTLLPYGAPLQKTSSPETIDAIFREGKPIVSDLIWGKNVQRYLVAVAVPVVRGGKVIHCLTLNFSPERLTRLLLRQQLPASWVAAINDQQRRVVARSVLADARIGKPTVEWFAAATRAAESGIVTGPLMDGRLGQIAFQRLQEVPWVVALAVPLSELQSTAPIWTFIIVGLILSLAAVVMAIYMGRKITRPVRTLARASEGLLRGEVADLRAQTGIREVQELQQALAQASTAARAHAEERERYAESLGQANEVLEARVLERTAALASANEALRAANTDLEEEIAQRKRAEEEIQTLARFPSENPNPVLRLDFDGRILFANAASAALLRQWGSAVGSPVPAPWPATVREALTSGSGTTVELACGDQTFSVFVAPVPEAGYVNLYTSDVTARKAAEQTLTKTLAELERSNRELEQFAYVASHDLQEPLRMVASYTQLLAKRYGDRLDQDAKDFIGFAVDGATRMQRLIQDLLAYSRVTTRGAAFGPTDAQIALRDALRNLEAVIQETGAVVTQDPLPTVRADATQLTQVFQNLVGNAVKFHGEAPARVHVTVTAQDAQCVFSVTDNGIGIDPQYFERIFVIFQRLHPSHRYPGTGIGLALCQRIVERHGGRMWVESAPGQGASFYFTLPRLEARDS